MKGFIIKDGIFTLGDTIETANSRIERMLTTALNEEYGFLDYGSRIPEFFHMKSTPETMSLMLSEIKMLFFYYEPSLKLVSMSASTHTPENSASDLLTIEIEYEVGGELIKTVVVQSKPMGEI
jgi:phage baseplate assembly protein W